MRLLTTPVRLVLLGAAALLLTACGGGSSSAEDDDAGIASLETTAADEQAADTDVTVAADGDGADEEEELTFEEAQLEFSRCMRDNGYPDWPDPDPNAEAGRAFGNVDFESLGIDPRSDEFRSASQACREVFDGIAGGRADLSPEQQAELEDNLLAMFACVRENPGWEDLPDPDFSAGGRGFGLGDLFQSGDIDPAEFRDLIQQCQQDLGIDGLGGGPGGRPAGGGNRTGATGQSA